MKEALERASPLERSTETLMSPCVNLWRCSSLISICVHMEFGEDGSLAQPRLLTQQVIWNRNQRCKGSRWEQVMDHLLLNQNRRKHPINEMLPMTDAVQLNQKRPKHSNYREQKKRGGGEKEAANSAAKLQKD